jgi:ATP-dependent Clp protease protease subunit
MSKRTKLDEQMLDNQDIPKSGEIWVNSFTEASASKFREEMIRAAMRDPSCPILIYIDSYGGYAHSLAKMIATMDQIPNPQVTICMGKAMSCGAILLSHGHYRYCDPHGSIMIHEVSAATEGCVHDMSNDVEDTKRLNKHFLGLLADNCGIKDGYKGLRELIKAHDGRDINLSAKEALKFGIVDEVGTPSININVTYETQTIITPPRKELVAHARQVLGIRSKETKKRKK